MYAAAPVTISEIMYHTGRNLPQWIELYNHSLTDGVNLNDWTLEIENGADDVPIRTDKAVTLKFSGGKIIPPNQTVLIVTSQARRHSSTDDGRPTSLISVLLTSMPMMVFQAIHLRSSQVLHVLLSRY